MAIRQSGNNMDIKAIKFDETNEAVMKNVDELENKIKKINVKKQKNIKGL